MRLIASLAAILALLGVPALAANVGFEEIKIADEADKPLTAGIWYPTASPAIAVPLQGYTQTVAPGGAVSGYRLPLVVFSHGGGGSYAGHYDTALALARAGFIVAAVSHTGDTRDDQSQVLKLWRRPAQLRRLVSYMLHEWPQHDRLDGTRVGAFGFSNGGFTVLVTAGGVPELGEIGRYCEAHPDHDLCQALKQAGVDPYLGRDIPAGVWTADARVRAIVVAAPAFGFTFNREGLKHVRIPIQLWTPADDHHQPSPYYDDAVRAALPQPPEYHLIANADHYDFLPPCPPDLATRARKICTELPGFNRAAFHEQFNAEVVRFFEMSLR